MRKLMITSAAGLMSALLAIALFGPWNLAIADNDNDESRCDLRGSWVGESPSGYRMLVTYAGATPNFGTDDLELIDFPPESLSPEAAGGSLSSMRGVWGRIGPNRFSYTLILFVKDMDGNIVGIQRWFGVKTLSSEDCNSMRITAGYAGFDPADDPNVAEPLFVIPPDPEPGNITATRIRLDE